MSPLVAVKNEPQVLYRVGKHPRPLDDYPLLARWAIRAVYFLTGYQTTSEDIAIASDEHSADAMCLDGSYFYKPLYLDVPLPPEPSAVGPVVWPRSEARELYEANCPDLVAIPRREWDLLQTEITKTLAGATKRA